MSLQMKYFVLKPKSKRKNDVWAGASRAAMRAYAKHIEKVDAVLAIELRMWAEKESQLESSTIFEEDDDEL